MTQSSKIAFDIEIQRSQKGHDFYYLCLFLESLVKG